jgi:hypothetical protein
MRAVEIAFESQLPEDDVTRGFRAAVENRPRLLKGRYEVDWEGPETGERATDPEGRSTELTAILILRAAAVLPSWTPGASSLGASVSIAVEGNGDGSRGTLVAIGKGSTGRDACKLMRSAADLLRERDPQLRTSAEATSKL